MSEPPLFITSTDSTSVGRASSSLSPIITVPDLNVSSMERPVKMYLHSLNYHEYPIEKFVGIVLVSGYLKETRPLSAMLVAHSGDGKSDTIRLFEHSAHTLRFSRATAWGLTSDLKEEILFNMEPVTHVLIGDLTALLGGSEDVGRDVRLFIMTTAEDGLDRSQSKFTSFDAEEIQSEVSRRAQKKHKRPLEVFPFDGKAKLGWVTAMTPEDLNDRRRALNSLGFLNRFIPFSYTHSDDHFRKILEDQYNERPRPKVVLHQKLSLQTKVTCDPKLLQKTKLWISGRELRQPRYTDSARIFLKAVALSHLERTVTQAHVDEANFLSHYINEGYNRIYSGGWDKLEDENKLNDERLRDIESAWWREGPHKKREVE